MPKDPIPWTKIKKEWVSTDTTFAALGRKYGINRSTICIKAGKDGWEEDRNRFQATVNIKARARIEAAAVDAQVSLYDASKQAAANIIDALLKASQDPEALYRHVVPVEYKDGQQSEKTATDKVMKSVNGRNASDIARAIQTLASLARVLDGIVEAPVKAKLDIEREKLELDKRRAGMSDDIEQESGIALMPAVDQTLLDSALPDPDQPQELPGNGEKHG